MEWCIIHTVGVKTSTPSHKYQRIAIKASPGLFLFCLYIPRTLRTEPSASGQVPSTPNLSTPPNAQHSMGTKGWYTSYRVPDLPDGIKAKILRGETLSASNESAVLDIIFESVRRFTV